MCILIHHTPETNFELGHLQDFFNKNSDGFGAMVKQPDGVKIIKTVGNIDEIHELYNNEIKGYEAVIHFRMKTHGDIDLFNCHPYQVNDNLWMAHNGILSTGNAADTTKSDTWHYINDYLRPLLAKNPELISEPAFQKLIESHIGYTNKFGFMDGDGNVVIINRNAGVEHFGAWLSNTYAWTPSKWGFYQSYGGYASADSKARYDRLYGNSSLVNDYQDYQATYTTYNKETNTWEKNSTTEFQKGETKKGKRKAKKSKGSGGLDGEVVHIDRLSTESLGRIIRSCYNAMKRNPAGGLVDWVIQHPMKAMHLIREFYPSFYTAQEVSDLVNSDPDQAADVLDAAWYECEEDMCAIAGIPFSPKMKGFEYESYDL